MDRPGQRHHDWLSPDYARYWVADAEARDPDRAEQLALLAALIPRPRDAAIRVLDLGAGYGPVARAVLATFPRAQVTLLDYSEAMLEHARPRLAAYAAQVRYVLRDLSRPGWEQGLDVPFDAVVSASVLHNLGDPQRIAALYGEIARVLAPGGAFLNLDLVSAGGPRIERQFALVRPAPRHGPIAEVEAAAEAEAASAPAATATRRRFPAGLVAHLEWLRAAGFAEVDCFWKSLHRALYGGYLP
jgi:tRNA (cmo5U34)-methyltransferase